MILYAAAGKFNVEVLFFLPRGGAMDGLVLGQEHHTLIVPEGEHLLYGGGKPANRGMASQHIRTFERIR